MNGRTTTITTCLLALALAVPAYAIAKDNDIDQGKFESWSDTKENIKNNLDGRQDPNEGGAVSASNCQLVIAAEVSVASLASSSALALVSDEDEVVITEFPEDLDDEEDVLDAETADSGCIADVGPVLIDLITATGWGSSSPHGSVTDLVGALSGGHGRNGGGNQNDIDQGRFEMNAETEENVMNEWELDQGDGEDTDDSALAASNCQAIIGARLAVLAAAVGHADATIEDSDTVTITGAEDARTSGVGFSGFEEDELTQFTADNDQTATASCDQGIESITILIRPETATIPPRS